MPNKPSHPVPSTPCNHVTHVTHVTSRKAFTPYPFELSRHTIRATNLTMNKISVLLADDHTLVRQGLKALLSAEGDMQVVAEPEDGRQAVALAKYISLHAVEMVIATPAVNGLG